MNSKRGLISTPAVELWNLGVEFSKFELLNSTPKFQNSTAGVEISHFEFINLRSQCNAGKSGKNLVIELVKLVTNSMLANSVTLFVYV